MADVLKGIEQNVPFSGHDADRLAAACRAAAGVLEAQYGPRQAWRSRASAQFRGFYAGLFKDNGARQLDDGRMLADALRVVASQVGRLKDSAEQEQARRVRAREWKAERDNQTQGDSEAPSQSGAAF